MTLRSDAMVETAMRLARLSDQTYEMQDAAYYYQREITHHPFDGEALDIALANVRQESDALSNPASKMSRINQVLEKFAPLQQKLESFRLLTLPEVYMDEVNAIARVLDWVCARSIDHICTPETIRAPRRLGDFGELDIPDIHQLNLSQVPPDIKQLAAHNPDMYLLETSDNTLVALIAPEGVATSPASVTTVVEGVGSSERQNWPYAVNRARALANATGGATALWLGYSAPPTVVHGVQATPALHAGAELTRFQRSLNKHFPGAKKIVAGHSYGSVVAGYAAQEGLEADELVLIGSPGVGVSTASELSFAGTVTAVTSPNDSIALSAGYYSGIHGPDPTSRRFGAQPFPTQTHSTHTDYWGEDAFMDGMRIIAHR